MHILENGQMQLLLHAVLKSGNREKRIKVYVGITLLSPEELLIMLTIALCQNNLLPDLSKQKQLSF
jgi:hypothetical protein